MHTHWVSHSLFSTHYTALFLSFLLFIVSPFSTTFSSSSSSSSSFSSSSLSSSLYYSISFFIHSFSVTLQKELGDRLLPCFSTASHIPYSDVNLATGRAHDPRWGPDSSVSEVTSIQLEFRDLTQLTGDLRYQEAVDRALNKVQSQPRQHDLVPLFINVHTGNLRPGTLTLGARADSYYEYLLKQWLQSGQREEK